MGRRIRLATLSLSLLGACSKGSTSIVVDVSAKSGVDVGQINELHVALTSPDLNQGVTEFFVYPLNTDPDGGLTMPVPTGQDAGSAMRLRVVLPQSANRDVTIVVEGWNRDDSSTPIKLKGVASSDPQQITPAAGDTVFVMVTLTTHLPTCGNGQIDPGESCDPGIDATCDFDCMPPGGASSDGGTDGDAMGDAAAEYFDGSGS